MSLHFRDGKRHTAAAFTLIELLAVILIITILVAALTPMINGAIERAQVFACQANLREIHKGTILYQTMYGRAPNESGVKFFAQLYSRDAMEQSEANAKRLTCPAVDLGALTIGNLPWDEWWSDLEAVDGSYSAYAGRDCGKHPLRKFPAPASEPLIADDNDTEMNHRTATNVLYGDGFVKTFELAILEEEGVIGPDESLVVGPGSQVVDLRKLSLD